MHKLGCRGNSSFQIWHSHYIFVNSFYNVNPRIKILLFLDSAKGGLLKNVQYQVIRCFRSQKISKTKMGTFFKQPVGIKPTQPHLSLGLDRAWQYIEIKMV